ncbi:MAG: FHA domain-containing protein [Proteobacteria bacterium]|nr:FHA domain-containing protein [Pseudomonadota bacterium]
MLQLQVIHGKDSGKKACFQKGVVRIGTDCDNDFQLSDPSVSRFHGVFVCHHHEERCSYSDLQSQGGSRVSSTSVRVTLQNRQRAQSVVLPDSSLLSIGTTTIQCTHIRDSAASDVPHATQCRESHLLSSFGWPSDTETLTSLAKLSLQISGQTSFEAICASMVRSIFNHLSEASHVVVWRHDAYSQKFSCVYERCRGQETLQPITHLHDYQEALMAQKCIRYGLDGCSDLSAAARACIVVPIISHPHPLGVIVVNSPTTLTGHDMEWLSYLSHFLAPAAKRTLLDTELSDILDGFIEATISVLDARDPATAGHSVRVASYVLMTAQAIHASEDPVFQDIRFSKDLLDELRYAALLHDIGKVMVKEEILRKAGKLMPNDYHALLDRLDLFRAYLANHEETTSEDSSATFQLFERYRELIIHIQHADTAATPQDKQLLDQMTQTFIPLISNMPLLTPREHSNLLIPYGTLNADERRDIEAHALVSWKYLSKIAWPQRWANVPTYVLQHHEKLDGTGYPYGISGAQIHLQSRLIAVCDIFDALTGGDRPYKARHSFAEAAKILTRDASKGALDANIVDLFIHQILPRISEHDAVSTPSVHGLEIALPS